MTAGSRRGRWIVYLGIVWCSQEGGLRYLRLVRRTGRLFTRQWWVCIGWLTTGVGEEEGWEGGERRENRKKGGM